MNTPLAHSRTLAKPDSRAPVSMVDMPGLAALAAILISALGGTLLALSFNESTQVLVWVGLVGFALALKARSWWWYAGAYFGGLLFNAITTDWIRTISGNALGGERTFDWLLQAQLLALFWPLTLLYGRAFVRLTRFPMWQCLPIVWTCHEFVVKEAWWLIDQTGWVIYQLGHALADWPVLCQSADIGGVPLCTALVACANGLIVDIGAAIRNHRGQHDLPVRIVRIAAIPASLIVGILLYGEWRLSQPSGLGPIVSLVPTSALEQAVASIVAGQEHAPDESAPIASSNARSRDSRPDMLLFSELAYSEMPILDSSASIGSGQVSTLSYSTSGLYGYYKSYPDHKAKQRLEHVARRFAVPMVVGCKHVLLTASRAHAYNSAAFVSADGYQGCYDKVHLVPWTEFSPNRGIGPQGPKSGLSHGIRYPLFSVESRASGITHTFATAICYDVAFPGLFRRYMQSADGPPEFFVVLSSEKSDQTGSMQRHTLAQARFRAIECRRSLVRNTFHGHSGVIDGNGKFIQADFGVKSSTPANLGQIPIDRRQTVIAYVGEWVPMLAGLVILGALCQARLGRRRRDTSKSETFC